MHNTLHSIYYIPPTLNLWSGRSDLPAHSAFFQIVKMSHIAKLQDVKDDGLKFALVGFKSDEGVKRNHGRVGAFEGPTAIRNVFAKLPYHRKDFSLYDFGDVVCADGNLEAAQSTLASIVSQLIKAGFIPLIIGGGHEVAFGSYQGVRDAISDKNLGIINFDAHFDLRPLLANNLGSSGTPFLQIALDCKERQLKFDYNCIGIQNTGNIPLLFETAKENNVNYILADSIHKNEIAETEKFINRIIEENDAVYTTICLDVFSSGFAPGVSAVQPLGLSPWQVIPSVRKLATSGKVKCYDIAELCPIYDIENCTAKLAACLLYEIIDVHKNAKIL